MLIGFLMEEIMLLDLLKTMVQWFLKLKIKAVIEPRKGTGLKTLTPKQLLQRLLIALAQVKAGNNSGKLFILCINQKKSLKKYTIT